MKHQNPQLIKRLSATLTILFFLGACTSSDEIPTNDPKTATTQDNFQGLTIKLLVGSALGDFCEQASQKLNQQQLKLDSGTAYRMKCSEKGSGDVVTTVLSLAKQLKSGTLPADSPEFPTIVSVDGEIYQAQ